MNDLNKISVFRSYTDLVPEMEISVWDFCCNVTGNVRTGTISRHEISKLRTIEDKERRDEIKATLPAVTISGTFYPTRKNVNLSQHSGFICPGFGPEREPRK